MADHALRVMLAENNPVDQTVLRHLLENMGHTVTLAEHGARALELAATEDFDVALIATQLPVMDGETATKLIRMLPGERANLPVLALIADSPVEDARRLAAAGATAVLSKPVKPGQLGEALRGLNGSPSDTRGVPEANDNEPYLPALDSAYLEDMRQWVGNKALQTLLTTAPKSFRAELTAIQEAWAAGDLCAVRENAHRLKGAAGSVGCRRLAHAAQIMQCAETLAPHLLEQLLAEAAAAIDAIAAWRPAVNR